MLKYLFIDGLCIVSSGEYWMNNDKLWLFEFYNKVNFVILYIS